MTSTKKTNLQGFLKTGLITSAHGLKGFLFAQVLSPFPESHTREMLKLLAVKATQRPIKVVKQNQLLFEGLPEQVQVHKKGLLLKLPHIHSLNQALTLKSSSLWLSQKLFLSSVGESFYLSETLGFQVYDQKTKALKGVVVSFSHNGADDILIIKNQQRGKWPLLLRKEFVKKTDFLNQKILVRLPEDWPEEA